MRQLVIASIVCTSIASVPGQAHEWSAQECREVADFLKNAALSRDYGMSADEFLARMRSDFELVRAFPPELRWIVADAADEKILLDAASQVFDVPRQPDQHQGEFLDGCLQRFALR